MRNCDGWNIDLFILRITDFVCKVRKYYIIEQCLSSNYYYEVMCCVSRET